MPISTDLDKVRLEIGDTDVTAPLLSDEEVNYFINGTSSVLLAAAAACDALARRFAREYDFTTDGQSFKRGQRSAFYAARAKELRGRAGAGSTSLIVRSDTADAYADYSN